MNTVPLDTETVTWPEPDVSHLTDAPLRDYLKRKDALQAVIGGMPVAAAARAHKVNRTSLTKALEDCSAMAPDGTCWGWRACIPRRVRSAPEPEEVAVPERSGPGAFTKLLHAIPALVVLLAGFVKPLPTRVRRSTAFEAFMERFLRAVRKHTDGVGYPFTSADNGRRAIMEYLQRQRRERLSPAEEDERNETESAGQLKEMFALGPLERVEFDAHKLDCDLEIEVEDAAGVTMLRRIQVVWLLVVIDAITRLILGWTLVFGRGYSQVDVLRVFQRALTPWEARDLLAPDMEYWPGSGVGTVPATGSLQRGIFFAMDNALAHHAKLTKSNLTGEIRGVLHLGYSRVPETRGLLEATFKRLENGAIRRLPGGFEPARDVDTPKQSTAEGDPKSYPVNLVAFHDLMDVVVASHNATTQSPLGNRSPIDVTRFHRSSGGWVFESSLSGDEAQRLTRMRFNVTICANQKKGRQPFVRFKKARYRAHAMRDRWDLVGTTYRAYTSTEDLRFITLLDENGDCFVRLTALPPWRNTRHDLDLRKLILRWSNRGLFSLAGVDDAIEAYRTYVRDNIADLPAAVEQTVRYPDIHQNRPAELTPSPAFLPRSGQVSFDHIKDPIR